MYKIIPAAVLMVLTIGSTLYAGDRRVMVVDDRTGSPLGDAEVLLIPIRYQFNPADSISLWRKEIHSKTDEQGGFIVQDSDFLHPTRSGRATEVSVRICKAGYWPAIDTLKAKMIFISFLKPSDLPPEYRLKKATAGEYMSGEYFWSLRLCPETEEKKLYVEEFIPAEAQRFKKNILSDDPEIIVKALGKISDSPIMTSGGPYTEDVLAATGKILAHKDPTVRIAACRVLADFRTPSLSPGIVQDLLLLLEDTFAEVRTIASEAVIMHGNEAVTSFKPSILDLLRRPEPGMQDTAVKTIAKYSEYQQSKRNRKGGDPDIVAALRKLLYQSSDAEQVNTLLFTLGNLGHDNYFQDLEYLYNNPEPRIQQNVITMMRLKTTIAEREKALPYFIEGLQSPDASVRYAAVAGIDALGDRSQIEPLENLLQTEKEPSLKKFTRETISRLEKK
jgi:HEAT repeat protein